MMIMVRHLLVVSFLALLSGCALVSGTCYAPSSLPITPSSVATTASRCSFLLTVTKIDPEEGWVKGKYPQYLIDEYKADPKVEYTFLVKDLGWWKSKKLLVVDGTYIFVSSADSAFLQPYFIHQPYKEKDESKDPKKTPY